MNHNTAPAPNSAPATNTATTTGSIVSEEFGDVNQYKELNAIGTGDVYAVFILVCVCVFNDIIASPGIIVDGVVCLRSVYHLFHFCVCIELTSDRHVFRQNQTLQIV